MNVVQETPDFQDNLTQLQEESLNVIALFAGVVGYFWLVGLLWRSMIGRSDPISAWLGAGLLATGVTLSLALKRNHLRHATYLLVWSIMGATICAMLTFQAPESAYLFILPIIFASVLFGQWTVFLMTAIASLLILGTGFMRIPVISLEAILPVVIIALVSVASWLSARNLYTALAWVWNGYERAHHNELRAREHQAELRRTLKALDETSHRLERTNYVLTIAHQQAEEARRLKQQFARTISHELRTPINLIVGFTELMTESPEHYGSQLPNAYLRDLNIIHRNASHLQNLVNDILDLARIEAAQVAIMPEETDPATLVQEAVDTVRSLVEAHGLALYTEVESDLPRLWVDATRIRQVLLNLLNNAVRFTEEGNITVSVHQCDDKVVFAVTDTGVGIAAEDIPNIFEEFQQVAGGTERARQGTGLGLAISRRFVDLHHGHIWVESRGMPGQGSTFYFNLPVEQSDKAFTSGIHSTQTHSPISAKVEEPVLLAVTRSPAAAALLTRHVRGCRTVVVPDLEHAQATAQQLMPQTVIVDKACEPLNSRELERLAQTWELAHTSFIACPLPGEELLRQQMAVEGYLIKPVSRQSLWDVLRQFGEHVDRVLVIDDDQDFVLLMSRMLEDSPVRRYRVATAFSGQEGLMMMRQRRPDLVLLDLELPDIHGLEVIEDIRSHPEWHDIPIVIVSAQGELENQETLTGSVTLTKANGLTPGEVVQWVQYMVDTTITRLLAPPVLPEVSAL